MKRIVCCSDIHGLYEEVVDGQVHTLPVPEGDMLVIAGDWTGRGSVWEVSKFLGWVDSLPHESKILVAGNHDGYPQAQPALFRSMLSEHPKITYLEDQETQACGFRVYGTPWSLTFMDWSFMLPEEQLSEKWARISDDTQILVTHSPPYTFLDELNTKHLGSKSLAKRIGELDNLRLHIFGHIHCGYGAIRHPQCLKKLLVNASVCDEDYRPVNPIRIVDL